MDGILDMKNCYIYFTRQEVFEDLIFISYRANEF